MATRYNATTSFSKLQDISNDLPLFAAAHVLFDGKANDIHCPILTHGVSEDNIEWLEELDETDRHLQAILNVLGMAFWQYDNEMRAELLHRLPCFDPFSNCPIGGLMSYETEDSLYAVAIKRPASYLQNWGKFRNIGCHCVAENQSADSRSAESPESSESLESRTDVCTGGRSVHPHTAIALRVLSRIRAQCPDLVKIAEMVPPCSAFY